MANPYPVRRVVEETHFHQKDAIKSGAKGALVGGLTGIFASAVQNSLAKEHVGAWGVFTRTGSTVTSFLALSTVYSFSKDAVANLREKDDVWNTAVAAFLGGATLGLRTRRFAPVVGAGAAFSVVMSTFAYTGGSLVGTRTEVDGMDEYERKEYLRKNRRILIWETVADIGEGRGIEPIGYEQRRRYRLKKNYGFDVNPVSALSGAEDRAVGTFGIVRI
ncbi:hypothetical protein F4861DRAFT_543268 [Xylaria intraflava]|nr:hypothetical protein F4861DRAFT_543268 [Xylaria intraflava]